MKTSYTFLILFWLAFALRAQDSVTTLAGQAGVIGAVNGTGTNGLFGDPAAIVADANGNYFVADSSNHAIRKVSTNGAVTTFAGSPGLSGNQNATGTNAQFDTPSGLTFDPSGNLLVSDTGNNVIRQITVGGAVSTFAGVSGSGGFLDGTSASALFNSPLGIVVSTEGVVFVADSGNHCIRKISNGTVATFAGYPQVWGSADGSGTNAQFNGPCGLKFDAQGNLFVSDANNSTIRKITPDGAVTTFAGSAGEVGAVDGRLSSARFSSPAEMVFDDKGNLFVADSLNQTIRKISTDGVVSTVCGATGNSGAESGANGIGRFFNPYGLAFAVDGSLVVADTYNELLRRVIPPFSLSLQTFGTNRIITISWDAVIGNQYQVQFKTDLYAAWSNLGLPVTASRRSLTTTDVGADRPRFYRIVRLN